ncbi:hypothetical protein R1sor_018770 [Riccia sorocarpa]|uniref:NUC153 domain-containing protein n=1 Tax=Riccia sorocarpa TaxID=122646 RepID=A0ABD3IAM1_9MARC
MAKDKMKKSKDGTGGGGGEGGDKASDFSPPEIVGDTRFSKIHNDPRFQRLPRHKTKVPIDSRFAHMFHDKAFAEKKVDKRGGATKTNKQEDFLRRYYKYDEEEEEDSGDDSDSDDQVGSILRIGKQKGKTRKELKESRKKKPDESESGSEGGVEEESDEELKDTHLKKSKAKIGAIANGVDEVEDGSESDADSDQEEKDSELDEDGQEEEESSSSSSSSSESESEDDEEPKEEEKVPTTDRETNRLALMNMDWDHIRAVDLLVVLRSFQPKGGNVESVSIYPSEFGIEQMAKDATQGPQAIYTHDDDGSEDEADPEKLREYEMAKLRYYYAVAVCDSVATAACVYSSCDGLEYEKTSNTLDLRFIPDDMRFTREPRDSAEDIPSDYKPVEFETKALQHSNVKLTWDDDEPLRAKALRRKFNADQLNEQDYRDYIASSSSESGPESELEGEESSDEEKATGEEKQKLREKYLSLLSDTGGQEGNGMDKKVEKGNIEIKFNTGLDELSEKLTEKLKKTKADETVWESYLRKKREKKKARKNKANADDSDFSDYDGGMASDGGPPGKDDPFFSHDEDPFDDPFFQDDSSQPSKGKNKGKKAKDLKGSTTIGSKFASSVEERKKKKEEAALEKKEEERRKAELELLLMDDDVVQKGVAPMKTPKEDNQKKESKGNKKKKKGKEKAEEVQEKLAATANYEDPRFSSLFTSHHFALDPTDPQFKKSAAQLSTIAEKQRRRLESGGVKKKDEEVLENGTGKKRKAELSSLVRSLKSKVQARK